MKSLIVGQVKTKKSLDDSMIPAINIVFLLLIFFMIAGQIEASSDQLRIPSSSSEAELDVIDTKIELLADGTVLIDDNIVTTPLVTAISTLGLTVDSTVVCYVHKDLPASRLDPLLSSIRQLGITRLTLATKLTI